MIGHRLLQAHDFALVDRLQHPDSELPPGVEVQPLVPAELRRSAGLTPGLVSLSCLSESQKIDCLDKMEAQQRERRPLLFATLLRADTAVDRVIGHLCATLVARIRETRESVYLRQFDPRLFVQYDWLLTSELRQQLFGPITTWTVHIDGEWRAFKPPQENAATRSSSLQLTSEQARKLDDLQTVNEALALRPLVSGVERQQRAREMYQLLERGRAYGLNRQRDIALLLEQGMTVHPDFDRHPALQQRLRNLPKDADLPYTAAVADLSDASFKQIRADMIQGAGGPFHDA